ncbi:MAG: phosphate ABC transporter substrate-binding protein [Chlorobiaceae bacterium]|nr:phosphate ABC transporter substrate-binding protein [Chlorobiaceae bacterium]
MKKYWGKALSTIALISLVSVGPAEAKDGISLDGSTTVGPIAKSFAAYFTKKYKVQVTVSESGSGNGAKSLINKTCDIASMSRSMKPQEVTAAKSNGVNPVTTVVALDGLAIVVHPSNPVRALSKVQLADIYKGKVTNWSQVGGPNGQIVVIQRESNSGTQESFKELVVGKETPVTRNAETQASNGAVKNRVSLTRGAIGFIGLGFADSSVKKIAVNNILPTSATVKNGTYPLSRPLFFVTNGQPTGVVKQFVDLPKTPDGKLIIKELGFVGKY